MHPDTLGGDDATSAALRRSAEAAFKVLNDALSVALEEMENDDTNQQRYQHQQQQQQQQRPGWTDNVVRSARAKWGTSASTSTSAPSVRTATHNYTTNAADINLNEFVFNSGNGITSRMDGDERRDNADGDKENHYDMYHDGTRVSVFTSSSSSELDSPSKKGREEEDDDDEEVEDEDESGERTNANAAAGPSKSVQGVPMQRDVRSVWKASRKPQQVRRAPATSYAATGRRRGSKRWHRRTSKRKASPPPPATTTSGKADVAKNGHASGIVCADDDDFDDIRSQRQRQHQEEENRKRKEEEEQGVFYDQPTTYEELYGLVDERDGGFHSKRAKKQGTLNAFLFNSHP